jgi:hypothetical protein
MSTSPLPRRSGSAPTVLLILGSVFMLLAAIFSVALYIWGRSGPTYGENWNDLIAAGFIVYAGVPLFCDWPDSLRNRIGAEGQEKSGKQIRLSGLPTNMAEAMW